MLPSSGDLYVSDSQTAGEFTGRIFRIKPSGETVMFSDASRYFTNGMCVDRNGEWLYVVETWLPGVSRIRILDDGSAGERGGGDGAAGSHAGRGAV